MTNTAPHAQKGRVLPMGGAESHQIWSNPEGEAVKITSYPTLVEIRRSQSHAQINELPPAHGLQNTHVSRLMLPRSSLEVGSPRSSIGDGSLVGRRRSFGELSGSVGGKGAILRQMIDTHKSGSVSLCFHFSSLCTQAHAHVCTCVCDGSHPTSPSFSFSYIHTD